ncbi:ARID DNA-binding domain-containing protein [Tanacetum coccineum]
MALELEKHMSIVENGGYANETKMVSDSSLDHKGRLPLRSSTGTWKAAFFIIGVQTFNDLVAFLNLIKNDDVANQEWDFFRNRFNKVVKWFFNHYLDRSLPGHIPPVINGVEIHLFDLYKLIENLGGYLSVHFCQEFDKVGEIMGLPKGNGEEIRRCYMNFLEVLTSHFKTARAPRQGHNDALVEPAWKAEKDRNCLGYHQWNFGEDGAHMTRPAVLRGKKTMEHFGVKLEDTTDSQEQPTLPHYRKDQNLQRRYGEPSTSKMHEEQGSSTGSIDDFSIIT